MTSLVWNGGTTSSFQQPRAGGAVTPDGKKLFLPLADDHSLAVIDAERRRLAGTIPLPGVPSFALMARTFGICH